MQRHASKQTTIQDAITRRATMTLYTFTLNSGHGLLLGMAGLQIKEVSYYLRLKSPSVTCSYEHSRQGSDRAEDPRGEQFRNKGHPVPDGNPAPDTGRQSQSLLSRTFNCGALAPRRQPVGGSNYQVRLQLQPSLRQAVQIHHTYKGLLIHSLTRRS